MRSNKEALREFLIFNIQIGINLHLVLLCQVNGMKYYVAVSSFDKKQEANILIRVPGDKKEIKGSLRFNYMIPVPDECITKLIIKDIRDEKYRLLLNKEYRFCMDNQVRIEKKANKNL